MTAPILLLFRQDLRLHDHPALTAAADAGAPVIPVYILDEETGAELVPGAASRWWLHHSLDGLARSLDGLGARLILRRGRTDAVIKALVAETGAGRVVWSRCYEPAAIALFTRLKRDLAEGGVTADSHNAALLFEPWQIANKSGEPYRVYTPFWKAVWAKAETGSGLPAPLKAPERLAAPDTWPESDRLADWGLTPSKPDWAAGFKDHWQPGEAGARARFEQFRDAGLSRYKSLRNRPDLPFTSRLSPHLRLGEISPRTLWHATRHWMDGAGKGTEKEAEHFLKEVVWREFSYHLLYAFPHMKDQPLNPKFQGFPWDSSNRAKGLLRAWQLGKTGYPIVDAGMRELWATGWMHNRLRMITASFLVKDLLVPWQWGEAWFWDTLVDADFASNAAGWQWVAGCGADAAPYFRIFNPVLQGEKFDPQGDYVRRWVPELARLPASDIHKPWDADDAVLADAGVRLGNTYPRPIVDHGEARDRALAAFEEMKDFVPFKQQSSAPSSLSASKQ